MRLDVLATYNDSLLFAGRLHTPITLRDIVPALDRDDIVVDAKGVAVTPEGFDRQDDVIMCGDVRIGVGSPSELAGVRKPVWFGPKLGIVAASVTLHAAALAASSLAPKPTAEEVTRDHMSLMLHLLSVKPDAVAAEEAEGGTGTRAKGEQGAMGEAHSVRAAAIAEAQEFGMIGLLSGDPSSGAGVSSSGKLSGGGMGNGFGVGGRGRSGSGEGGGGIGHGRASTPVPARAGAVRAGEWDDNASLREFRRVLDASSSLPIQTLDVSRRRFLVARDSAGKPLVHCPVTITDTRQHAVTLRTLSSGRALFFPRAEGFTGGDMIASLRCGGNAASVTFSVDQADDGIVQLDGHEPRDVPSSSIDVGFALDTTGSMSEEIVAVKATLARVATRLQGVRVGLVEYKDRGDPYVTRVFGMSSDIPRFSSLVSALSASGGGDTPEAVSSGLHDAIHQLEWSPQGSARLVFLIGDAPPHANDDADMPRYADEARAASHAGIQIFTVAASGMDTFGQIVFRQLAQYTGGTEMFVLRGGAGPQSVGGGDPVASCGGTQTSYTTANLDVLIVRKIENARRAADADPLAIAGVGQDAAPTCSQ